MCYVYLVYETVPYCQPGLVALYDTPAKAMKKCKNMATNFCKREKRRSRKVSQEKMADGYCVKRTIQDNIFTPSCESYYWTYEREKIL